MPVCLHQTLHVYCTLYIQVCPLCVCVCVCVCVCFRLSWGSSICVRVSRSEMPELPEGGRKEGGERDECGRKGEEERMGGRSEELMGGGIGGSLAGSGGRREKQREPGLRCHMSVVRRFHPDLCVCVCVCACVCVCVCDLLSSATSDCARTRLLWCVCLSTLAVQTFCSCTAGTDRQTDGSPTDTKEPEAPPPFPPHRLIDLPINVSF